MATFVQVSEIVGPGGHSRNVWINLDLMVKMRRHPAASASETSVEWPAFTRVSFAATTPGGCAYVDVLEAPQSIIAEARHAGA